MQSSNHSLQMVQSLGQLIIDPNSSAIMTVSVLSHRRFANRLRRV